MAADGAFPYRLIDSHLHVWTDGSAQSGYTYASGYEAPPGLHDAGSADKLLSLMDKSGVEKALIVQPIIYLYDHSYVKHVMDAHPTRFRGMLNANPTLAAPEAAGEVRRLYGQGFKSIRFNPYIWPQGEKMDNPVGRAMYAEAGRLGMPVGFMLFKGLDLHIREVTALMEAYPETTVVIDHWGFFHQDGQDNEESWRLLLELARFPQVTVKVAAFFRVSSAQCPFSSLAGRLEELLKAYGSNRLMWGSDFPYVTTMGGGYVEAPRAVLQWHKEGLLPSFTPRDFENLFAGTFVRVFGE